jgi:hypothetical protein
MIRTALPQPLAEALDAVRTATSGLLAAASQDDPEALRGAVELRGLAIERLKPVMRDLEERLAADQRRALDDEAGALLRQGQDAEAAVASMLEATRGAVVSFKKGEAAVRGYAAPAGEPGGLDQSA